jgi:soluble cytochrome b562
LVSLKTTLRGGVAYERVDLVTGDKLPDGAEVSEWKTKRTIEDKEEHDAATKCRTQARSLITKVCSNTSFGLLCPNDQEGALDAAVKAARQLMDNFNDTSKHARVGLWVIKGRVASDDAEAARAITQEIAELTVKMSAGIQAFDPKAIREAADRARELSSMLSDEKQAKVSAAIEQARKAARTIVKRIEKEGEDRNTVMLDIQRGQIESARVAFLDMSGEMIEVEALPAVNAQRFADLDVSDAEPATIAPAAPTRQMEVE